MERVVTRLRARSVPLGVLLAVGLAALVLGLLLGNNTSLGAKQLTVLEGRAKLHNTENWLTSFDTDDPDDQLAFHANTVAWSGRGSSGFGDPPCLRRTGQEAAVRVGYTWVEFPDGGGSSVVAWVECLG